ncbi:cupin domain-containing protein [Ruminococcaceae bacterium OttesenSCG-928-I18]|nr:cupin domain-containing protein [Ruminococcaceae bacterium OttesenSCG-928-I18]
MIRKREEQPTETRSNMRGGAGDVVFRSLLTGEEEMNGKGRLYSVLTLPAGGSIGYHVHEGESETFYVLKGQGEFDDNGHKRQIEQGDVLQTPNNGGHSIANTGKEPLELMALILYV